MIFHEQPTEPWTRFDFNLLEAYQILQDETCNQCGNPIWLCRSTNNDIQFKMEKTVCHATATEEKWVKRKKTSKKDWEPEPGTTYYPVPYTISKEPLPTRFDYYRELVE